MSTLTLTHAQLLDPSQELNQLCDVVVEYGNITAITPAGESSTNNPEFNVNGQLLIPSLIDLSAHINAVDSETSAAAKGGISHLCTQPNSKPFIDSPANVSLLQQASNNANRSRLLPIGTLTQDLAGEQLANMYSLKHAGCLALSNAREPIKNALVLRRIMEYATTHNMLIMLTAQDRDLSANGIMHEGSTANRLGLIGIAEVAETAALAQQLLLVELTGCRTHFSQLSCGRSVAMIRDAKAQGLPVSADVAIANLMFTDEDVDGFDSTFHVQPPLRSESDRQALLAGVNDGTLAICSNHIAQDIAAKKAPFAAAKAGMSILDSWLSMMLTLVNNNELELAAMVNACSIMPAQILGLKTGTVMKQAANFVVVDHRTPVIYHEEDLLSVGKSNPVLGKTLYGKALLTLCEGREIYRATSA